MDRTDFADARSVLRLLFACFAVWLATATAHAQSSPAFHEQERRAALHDETVAATSLYLVGASSVTGGSVATLLGLFMVTGGPACVPGASCRHDDLGPALFLGGIASATLGALLLCVAIGLDVDFHSRRAALDRALSLAPGPGDAGLALISSFD